MRAVDILVEEFEHRWREAVESGCEAILFPKTRWMMLEMLLAEAKRSHSLRRELIKSRMRLRSAQQRRTGDDGGLEEDDLTNVISFPAAS